ncbi:hypothetical protein Tco_0447593, partial [Tanacetum coccineum]
MIQEKITQPPQQQQLLPKSQRKTKVILQKSKQPEEKVNAETVLKRLKKLERKVDAMLKIDHIEAIDKSVQAHLKNILPKHVPDFGKIKFKKAAKQQMPKYSTKPFDEASLKEYDLKDKLIKLMI